MKVVGQNFWYFIREDPHLYKRIVEPLGDEARQYNDSFLANRNLVVERFATELSEKYSTASGEIDWAKLIEVNSGNLSIDAEGNLAAYKSGDE
jgi:hypothetical protein